MHHPLRLGEACMQAIAIKSLLSRKFWSADIFGPPGPKIFVDNWSVPGKKSPCIVFIQLATCECVRLVLTKQKSL